jgi:excisionase family DNA binding protein
MEPRDRLLTPGEVAVLFRVDPKTVTRWAEAGHLPCLKTPGGHRRFRESHVRELLARSQGQPRSLPDMPAAVRLATQAPVA